VRTASRWGGAALLGFLAGCTDPTSSATTVVAPGSAGPVTVPGARAPDPAPSVVRLDAATIRVGDRELAKVRPLDAPGALDRDLRPSYAHDALREAFAGGPPALVEPAPDASVGAVRGVLASLPDDARPVLAGTPSLRVRAAVRGELPLILVLRDRVELRHAGAVVGSVAALAELPTILRGSDATLAVELADARPASDLLAVARAAAAAGTTQLVLAIDHAPCVAAPAGMACIPGGVAIVGSDDGEPVERPRREIELSTYYVDTHEITIAEYDACHAAGGCPRRPGATEKIMRPFVVPDHPAMPLDWERATRYCAWAGKRLPTEWEWEKAARGPDGDTYPWGDAPPGCERAQYRECAPRGCTPYPGKEYRWDCNEHDTKAVGTYPAGHYGLFEMAGNGYEWTSTVGVEDVAKCGAACSGRDPLGPCDGASGCGTTRVLRGGSWYWPAGRIRGAHRRLEKLRTGSHRLSARCATSDGFVTNFPPAAITQPLPAAAAPEPPTAEQAAIFAGVVQDPIEDKPICSETVRETWGTLQSRGGRSETTCRDPFPYLESNEPRAWLWQPYLANVGGAYLGVGSDQNYTFIAVARSQWAWVMDYDPRVVDHHKRLRAFVLEAATPEEFIALWSPKNSKRALEAIERHHTDAAELPKLRRGYWATHERLHAYYREQRDPARGRPSGYGWLADAEHYAYVRTLFQQGRLAPIKGDLLGKQSIRTVAATATALGVPLRVFYTSNAPSSWGGQITAAYRENLMALPFDRHSVVLQTTGKGGFRQSGHWHHNVEWGRHLQTLLRRPGYDAVMKLIFERIPTDHGDLTVVGLPAGDLPR